MIPPANKQPDGSNCAGRTCFPGASHSPENGALARRLAMCALSRETFVDGALISYAADYPEMVRRAAFFADRILKGAKPSDIPVEQPTKFQ